MEGTRPILLEIQALVCRTNFGMPRRTAAGTDYNRVNLLMAVLEKRLGMALGAVSYTHLAASEIERLLKRDEGRGRGKGGEACKAWT